LIPISVQFYVFAISRCLSLLKRFKYVIFRIVGASDYTYTNTNNLEVEVAIKRRIKPWLDSRLVVPRIFKKIYVILWNKSFSLLKRILMSLQTCISLPPMIVLIILQMPRWSWISIQTSLAHSFIPNFYQDLEKNELEDLRNDLKE